MLFMDRSGFGQWYVNGVASGAAVDISARSGSITNGEDLTLGAQSTGGGTSDIAISYAAMWKSAAWLDSHLQPTIAAARYAALIST